MPCQPIVAGLDAEDPAVELVGAVRPKQRVPGQGNVETRVGDGPAGAVAGVAANISPLQFHPATIGAL